MCFLMGCAAGGMLPVTYALLAEIDADEASRLVPRARSAASAPSAGTSRRARCRRCCSPISVGESCGSSTCRRGSILIALSPLAARVGAVPATDGPRRRSAATLARFGARLATPGRESVAPEIEDHPHLPPVAPAPPRGNAALTVSALSWSLVNFGLAALASRAAHSGGRTRRRVELAHRTVER